MAFEPERHSYNTLAGNVAINNLLNVYCFQQAMSNELGRVINDSQVCPIGINTIDNLKLQSCKMIKIDVEGMETQVVQGGKETIENLSPFLYINAKHELQQIKDILKEKKYKMFLHRVPLFNENNYYDVKKNVMQESMSINLFCYRHGCFFDPATDFGMEPIL
jgi:hypothetical protein